MVIAFNHLGKLGQLGNQMFQYASIIGVARKLGSTFMIPNHNEVIVDSLGNKLRIELFDCFDINPDSVGFLSTDNVYFEDGFEFNENLFLLDSNIGYTLYGFFQTEKYFKHCEEEVRKQFCFKKHIVDDCKKIIDEIYEKPIALHIRRGDFLINSNNHANQSIEYYQNALNMFDSNRQVIIFSDDPDWCSNQEIFSSDRFVVSENNSSYHDLYLMSQCSDFIIANSTFSWWGAWLANTGKVVAPSQWFGPNNSHLNTKDLYCKKWKVI